MQKFDIIFGAILFAVITTVICLVISKQSFYNENVGRTAIIKQLNTEGKIYYAGKNLFGPDIIHVRFVNKLGVLQEVELKDFEVEIK